MNSNFSLDDCFFESIYPPQVRRVAYGIVIPIVAGLGLLLNTFAILAVYFSTGLNGVTKLYMLWLSLANWALAILSIPWLIDRSYVTCCRTPSNVFYHAHIELVLLNVAATFSVYLLTCMSVERYFSVVRPAYFRLIHRIPRARAAIIVAAIASVVIQTPMFLTFKTADCCPADNATVTRTIGWLAYMWTNEILTRFVPCAALVFLNVALMFKYRRVIQKRGRMTANSASQLNTPSSSIANLSVHQIQRQKPVTPSHEDKRLLILLTGVVTLVLLCLLPAGVAVLLPRSPVFNAVTDGLELFHFAIVSFIFCLCNGDLQQRLWLMITCNSISSAPSRHQV